jgi:DNA helicase-2/ATP-dependent DNA helicase PcrA
MEVRTIYGPPGCGKTHDLTVLAGQESKKNPVLMLSYTKAAAAEIVSRIEKTETAKITGSTLHALAFAELNLTRASVIDNEKLKSFSQATGVLFKEGLEDDEQEGDQFRSVLSYSKSMMIPVGDAYDQLGRPGTLKRFDNFIVQYDHWKRTYGYLDFDDMLILASRREYTPPPIVMLDEAQDCSPLQWSLFERYTEKAKRVYVAGDDDQAIFEWNGADPHGMIKFSKRYGAKARVLDQSHRIPSSVHAFVHDNILNEIGQRVEKEFKARDFEGEINRWGGLLDVDIRKVIKKGQSNLLLVRDSYRMRSVEDALQADHILYSIAGDRRSPFENQLSEAVRALQQPDRATESQKAAAIKYARIKGRTWDELVQAKRWYHALAIPERLMHVYENVDLFGPIEVRLSTIHQAKGREADNVIADTTLTQRVEESIYYNRDAELRVWYVALTRAKQSLQICGENLLV